MIFDPNKPEGTHRIGEFVDFLKSKGLKPFVPNGDQRKFDFRQVAFTTKTLSRLAGVALVSSVVWTITYDRVSMGALEAKREHVITDTLTSQDIVLSTVVFLVTTGGATWTFDPSWNNASNSIEAIGTGALASNGQLGKFLLPGGGAGGGAYAAVFNQTISANKSYTIPVAGVTSPANVTWDTSVVVADSGNGTVNVATAGTGGLASNSTGTTKYDGGNGGTGESATSGRGGGGGGAAGPAGAGGTGLGGASGGTGGTGNNGATPANTDGDDWDATHGSGGGGNTTSGQRNGGLYGGGGAGGGQGVAAGGTGRPGIIVLTWTPADAGVFWRSQPQNVTLRGRAPRAQFFHVFANAPVPKAYVTPPPPSNLSWFQQNPLIKRKVKPRKRFIVRPLHRVPRQLTHLPHSNLSWLQQNPIIKGKFRPRGRFCVQFIYRRKIDIHFLPLPSNLTWAQQNPLIKRKLKPRKRYVIKFKLVKVPKAYVTPPRPSNLSWKRHPTDPVLKRARGRKRFIIHGRWPHLPRNVIGQFVPVTAYSPEGPGFQKWRQIKPKLERTRVVDGKLQK
jgi:hypothetical protein